MKTNFISIWKKVLNPPTWAKILTFIIALLTSIGAVLILFFDYENSVLEIVAYALFGLAGLSFSYSVYLIIPLFPKAKRQVRKLMEKHDFLYLLFKNFGFRTVIFSIISFVMSLLFSVFNAYMGIVNRSIWYGALATFYISLAFLRGGVLVYHKNRIRKKIDLKKQAFIKAKVYRNSGIITLILNLALSVAIAQMIFSGAHFAYMGWTIFAYAAYAFYKVITSIISFIRAHKQDDLTVRAIRNINLIDALVSILALQTALLTTFGDGTNLSLFNTLTGSAVSLLSVSIGIYMILSANDKIKKLQKELKHDE